MSKKYTKPILKWVGGKTQIIDKIISLFPRIIENYYEPFLGGGSVLLALLDEIQKNNIIIKGEIIVNDINQNIINLYKQIQDNPDQLINNLDLLINQFNKCEEDNGNKKPINKNEAYESKESYYYWIRKQFNETNERNTSEIAALTLFLNKTCFRGLYREGPNGFNVPYGNYKHPQIYNKKHILQISKIIQNVKFLNTSYENILNNIRNNSFIYLDPPYASENNKSFVSYTNNGFSFNDHNKLFQLCDKINNHNLFLLSNSNTKYVLDYFNDKYVIEIIVTKRSINSKDPSSKTKEVLIKNYYIQ